MFAILLLLELLLSPRGILSSRAFCRDTIFSWQDGLREAALLTWPLASGRQDVEAARKLRAPAGMGTASLQPCCVTQNSHSAHLDSRGWKKRS